MRVMPYALSLKQPWLELILQGRKTVETRNWNTRFRGEFYLHASRQVDKNACNEFGIDPSKLVTGAIVGKATLVRVKRYGTKKEFLKENKQHLAGGLPFTKVKYGYVLKKVQRVTAIPCKGKLRFFKVPSGVLKPKRMA